MVIAVIYLWQNGKFVDIIILAADSSWACCGWGRTSPFFFRTAARLHWSHCQSRRISFSALKALFFSVKRNVSIRNSLRTDWANLNFISLVICVIQEPSHQNECWQCTFVQTTEMWKLCISLGSILWSLFVLKYLFWSPQMCLEVVPRPP